MPRFAGRAGSGGGQEAAPSPAARRNRRGDRPVPGPEPGTTLPDPIPVTSRDPGFRHLFTLHEIRDWARETMCHIPGPAESAMLRRLDREIRAAEAEPMVADRSFEAVTHCPAGHVGSHRVGETVTFDDRDHVRRTCEYAACGRSWFEGS